MKINIYGLVPRLRWLKNPMAWLGLLLMTSFFWMWTDSSKVYRQIDVQLKNCHIYVSSCGGFIGFACSNFDEVGSPLNFNYYSEEYGLPKFEFPIMVTRKHAPEDMDADYETFIAYWFILLFACAFTVGYFCLLILWRKMSVLGKRGT
jgi:hypothetical protein